MRKIFLDTETTGFAPGQIGQLAYIIEEDNGDVKAHNHFFKVDYMSVGAEEICNRTVNDYEKLSKGQVFADRADELFDILSSGILIAHNLKFDENFISTEFWRLDKLFKPLDGFDTMSYFKDIVKIENEYGKVKNPKLIELANYYSINTDKVNVYANQLFGGLFNNGFHDAMFDTTLLFVIFHIYKDMLHHTNNWIDTFVRKG